MTIKRVEKATGQRGRRFLNSTPRRLAGQQPDPYAVRGAQAGPVVCKECYAIYEKKRWRFDESVYADLVGKKGTKAVTCPACVKTREGYAEGVLTLRWLSLPNHRRDVLGLLRKQAARAREVNPLERIIKIEDEGSELRVFTTNTKLAQRMGREMERAYHGKVSYHWSHQDKLVRVYWEREGA